MKRILVVEDDPFIGIDLVEQLAEAGYQVYGPVQRAREELGAARAA